MSEDLISRSERMTALDVFRGITIAGMILVNNPGTWEHVYKPLSHAEWNGWTPTDLIFPFFLFIVGVSMTFSFDNRIGKGGNRGGLFAHVCRRALILFILGLILAAFPGAHPPQWNYIVPFVLFIVGLQLIFSYEPVFHFGKSERERVYKLGGWILAISSIVWFATEARNLGTQEPLIRIPGVLQRIAVCYFLASIILFFTGVRGRIAWALGLVIGYWILARHLSLPEDFSPKGTHADGFLHEWFDFKYLGNNVYKERPDPEGIFSTMPAIASTLAGVLCGSWLKAKSNYERISGMFVVGSLLIFLGICMDYSFPINKKIWSSSYVVFSTGMALHFLALSIYLIDMKGYKKWSYPFLVFGTNPILVFFASGMLARIMYMAKVTNKDGDIVTFKQWIYDSWFASSFEPINASLFFAITYVIFWFLITLPLYRKRIFVKI